MLPFLLLACTGSEPESPPPYTEEREPCADFDASRKALYGDLHAHTGFSFDARVYDNRLTPADAHRFAMGEAVGLTPYDADGNPTRTVQLDRPLDWVAITDHGEFLGEVARCTTEGAPGYDSSVCTRYRDPAGNGAFDFGTVMASDDPTRWPEVCGDDGCIPEASERWTAMQTAAEAAYDRTAACAFTAFPSYEYTNTRGVSNRHRNVVFRNATVPALPITTFEAPTEVALWTQLEAQCTNAGTGCQAISIPHNSNLSNGWEFTLEGFTQSELELRARVEPIVEIFQHKGDSECRNQHVNGEVDPLCDFEKLRPAGDELCNEQLGNGGMRLWGCSHRLDFVRNVLLEGLAEQRAGRVNPYRLGITASTDTHNGTPGYVDSVDFQGHVGSVDDTAGKRLGDGNITHDTIITNPGGLTGVWAEENSRDAIWRAIERREVFATSGPRIDIRFFAGWDLPEDACTGDDLALYDEGVPMGGTLPDRRRADAPTFALRADQDRAGLAKLQIIKGWVDGQGVHEQVIDVVTADETSVDTATCEPSGGAANLCALWTDPDFDPDRHAFYYARAVEGPTCRWTTRQCASFSAEERPPRCDEVPETVQQRAWSSPIWFEAEG